MQSTFYPLPRTPPSRFGLELAYRQPRFWAEAEARFTGEQDRIAELDTVTDDFTFLNASAGYRFFTGGMAHQILLRGTNLTDEQGPVHTSFLKDPVLLPGRNLTLSYELSF